MSVITIEKKVLHRNDEIAREVRETLHDHRVCAINIVSSPGAGKTSLIERTLERLKPSLSISVVEGDVQTDIDAQRVGKYDVPVVQIITNGGCHLEAKLVQDAISNIDLDSTDLLLIENVGNLVCPANYDLGESLRVVIVSTTEGDDKPLKYPGMFQTATALIINKTDLVPYTNCSLAALRANALGINPSLTIFETSCTSMEGLDRWCDWLKKQTRKKQEN